MLSDQLMFETLAGTILEDLNYFAGANIIIYH